MRAAFCCDSFLEYPIPIPPDIPPSRACDWNTGLLSWSTMVSISANSISTLCFCPHSMSRDLKLNSSFEIDIWVDDTGLDEFLAVSVSFIQINGSDEGFEGIAEHVVVVRTGAHGIGDESIET